MKEKETIKSRVEFLVILGFIFIGIGILGSIGVAASFDYETYNSIKHLGVAYEEGIDMMRSDLITTWVMAGAILLVNVAIGSLFIAIDKIALSIEELKRIVKR